MATPKKTAKATKKSSLRSETAAKSAAAKKSTPRASKPAASPPKRKPIPSFPHSNPAPSPPKRKPAAAKNPAPPAGKPSPKPSSLREKLTVIRPSGEKENNFFELVHEVARQVPKGRVTSYGAIAKALGTGRSARMVGWAMNACHLSKRPVPAHRVVNSAGLLTGRHHFKPPEKMQLLLEKEGTKVVNNKVVDFKTKFWDPSAEL